MMIIMMVMVKRTDGYGSGDETQVDPISLIHRNLKGIIGRCNC